MANILLVEDEANIREVLTLSINAFGHEVLACANPEEAETALNTQQFEIVITDLRMDGKDAGLDIVRMSKDKQDNASILLLTAYASAETAVTAIRDGAFDYITKPVSRTELGEIIERALDARVAQPQTTEHHQTQQTPSTDTKESGKMIGNSVVMQRIRERLSRAAKRDFTVLVTGESGTGKELAARMVHELSTRAKQAFVPVHCGAIPENLFESELFGYIKGAFTGADKNKTGLIESADGGTLFLDEIGEMPMQVQVKLLRVLQDMKVRPVGSAEEKQVDVRIIAATNRDLAAEVELGHFREDLFYRLNVIPVHMPPLRQRREDVPDIVQSILHRLGYANIEIDKQTMEVLSALPLAGNVRELENTLQRLLALSDENTLDINLLNEFQQPSAKQPTISLQRLAEQHINLDTQLETIEKSLIEEALSQTKGNATKAADLLGISFRSIRYRMEKLGMKEPKQ